LIVKNTTAEPNALTIRDKYAPPANSRVVNALIRNADVAQILFSGLAVSGNDIEVVKGNFDPNVVTNGISSISLS
jgi:hypothetical protein